MEDKMYKPDGLIYKYICENIIVGVFGNMITKEMQTHMNYFRNAFKNEILQSQRNVFYVLYQNLPEHYYITNINNNNITKISITSKITKLPHKLNYDLQELIKSIEAQTKARLRSNAQS